MDCPKLWRTETICYPGFSPALDVSDKKRIQEVLGTLLYYARAIDSTMLPAIGTLATQQSAPTMATMAAITHLLNKLCYSS
jgi:hypothetical protein